MNHTEIKDQAETELRQALNSIGIDGIFTIEMGEPLTGKDELQDGFASIECDVLFRYHNCEHKHALIIGWNESDGIGLEHGEDGDIQPITFGALMRSLYLDLALADLADEFLQ